MAISQKDAVFKAVASVLAKAGIKWAPGRKAKRLVKDEVRQAVVHKLSTGLKSGRISLVADIPNEELDSYATKLLANWLNRDERLGGNRAA